MSKKYNIGMYGGKFLPFHKGHLHCLETAAHECETVYLIMFYGGNEEQVAVAKFSGDADFLSVKNRMDKIIEVASGFKNVIPIFIDVSKCRLPDGSEDWDAETPLVLSAIPCPNAVYGSEPKYADYFARAYPGCYYRMVDPARSDIPISATEIRNMSAEERKVWLV